MVLPLAAQMGPKPSSPGGNSVGRRALHWCLRMTLKRPHRPPLVGRRDIADLGSRYSPLLDPVSETVRLAFAAAHVTERHLAASPGIVAGTTCNGEHRVALVVERPLDGQLALLQCQRPETLPRLAGQDTEADALVGADLDLVVGVEHPTSGALPVRALGRVVEVAAHRPMGAICRAGRVDNAL
jgi:hypothetical protein